jgi:hypothetical protein
MMLKTNMKIKFYTTDRGFRVPGYGSRQPNISRLRSLSTQAIISLELRVLVGDTSQLGIRIKWRERHVRFVCRKQNCHSSNHKEQDRTTLAKYSDYVLSQVDTRDEKQTRNNRMNKI